MGKKQRILTVALLFLGFGAGASADPILYQSQSRGMEIFADAAPAFEEFFSSAADFGPYDDSLSAVALGASATATSDASQTSTLGASSILVSLSNAGTITGGDATSFADNGFNATFNLSEDVEISLAGNAFASGPESVTFVQLVGSSSGNILGLGGISDDNVPIDFNAVLSATEQWQFSVASSFEFAEAGVANGGADLVLSVVPEPASATIVILGAALAATRRRRRRPA